MVAALDLGSNSFHLIVASLSQGRLQIVDRIKDMVRLAAALDDDNKLDKHLAAPALQALERYGERLKTLPAASVRAVGTNTLRKARNSNWFVHAAEEALGHQLHIISGREEARLIYVGVAHASAPTHEQRLVVDIGGGSTEIVLGRGVNPGLGESMHMGCVETTRSHLRDGRLSAKRFRGAYLGAMQQLEPVVANFSAGDWDVALGSSGTIRSVHNVCRELGFSDEALTREGLDAVRAQLLKFNHIDEVRLPGLSNLRQPVFAGGLAILSAVFDALGIERMLVSRGALREGLLYELVGRIDQIDVCEHTVDELQSRFQVDREHAQRVLDTAMYLLAEVADAWRLDTTSSAPLLSWAAKLHEIGLPVSHSQYQKHGAYLLGNMDMPGFSRSDQARVAVLVRGHRRKFPNEEFDQFTDAEAQSLIKLAVLLRVATLLHRSRSADPLPLFDVTASERALTLRFPGGWLTEHPLTGLDLEQEAGFLKGAQFSLRVE